MFRRIQQLSLVLMLILGSSFGITTREVHAAAFNDAATGNWDIGTTWGGGCSSSCTEGTDYPGSGDIATIDSHTVTLTANHAVDDIAIASGGTLSAGAYRLIVYGGWNNTGGVFNSGTSIVLFKSTASENITSDNDAFNDFVINDGLLGYWPLDEASANTCSGGVNDACDKSGYGYDGAWAADASPDTSVPSVNFANTQSVDFDGTDDSITIASSSQFAINTLTISAWINMDDLIGDKAIVGTANFVFKTNGTNLRFTTPGIRDHNSSGLTVTTGTWHHIAVTFEASTSIAFYYDGTRYSSAQAASSINTSASTFTIGTNIWDQFIDGRIDDVRVYDRILSSAEISRLANGNHPATSDGVFTLQDALDVNADIYLNAGTLAVDVNDITVAGDWNNYGGIFEEGTRTVTLDGTSQSVPASETFYNLTKTVVSTDTLTFGKGTTQTISNTLTLQGAASNLLSIRSSKGGTRFAFSVSSTQSVSFLNVTDSEVSGAANVHASSSVGRGQNNDNLEAEPHWGFGPLRGAVIMVE